MVRTLRSGSKGGLPPPGLLPNGWVWSLVVFLAGAGSMIIEVSAPRLMQPYFGASTFVWTNVIGVVLLALAMGYRMGGRLADRGSGSRTVGLVLVCAAALALLEGFYVRPVAQWLLPEPVTLAAAPEAYRQLRTGSLLAAAIVFAPAVFLLGMVSPVVINVLVRQNVPVGSASGRVFMWGTIGSLAGTFIPTYLLVPALGSRETLAVAATMLALPGAVLLLRGRGGPVLLAGGIALGVLSGAGAYASFANTPINPPGDGQSLLFETESSYQYLRVVRKSEGGGRHTRMLNIDQGAYEAQSILREGRLLTGTYYDTMALFPALAESPEPLSVAILGSGAGTLSRLLLKLWPERVRRIVNVEIDPAVLGLQSMFDYEPPPHSANYPSYEMDGRIFLSLTEERFDLVYLDMYIRQSDIPYHVATEEFFAELWRAVKPGGIAAMNIHTFRVPRVVVEGLARGLSQGGGRVFSTPSPDVTNIILWARNGDGGEGFEGAVSAPAGLSAMVRHARRLTMRVEVNNSAPHFTDNFAPVGYLQDAPAVSQGTQ